MFKNDTAIINLSALQTYHDSKRIDLNNPVDLVLLKKLKVVNKNFSKLKILGTGEIKNKIEITANFISKQAKNKIEKIGGKLVLLKK